ncbi:MAG: nicotinate (nicotinamide) nucleotide adenylyltransferase [Bacteroidota bacterium]|nr:nicotinate (nicotinamide) nucleotide adenylyltransferase [Bacteroidota bacterium]
MHVGLFFGSFNPIHKGHEAIALYMLRFFDEIWLVVSPQNPFKINQKLVPVELRLEWAKAIFENNKYIQISEVELQLPLPSFTYQTLEHLQTQYPSNTFSLIMGADNLRKFYKWKNYKDIIHQYQVYIYNRVAKSNYLLLHDNIVYTHAPLLNVSSTIIRESIYSGGEIEKLIDEAIVDSVKKYYNGATP